MHLSPNSRLPLSRLPRFETNEFDEASDIYTRMTTPVRIQRVSSKEPFRWRAHTLALGGISISTHETRGRLVADCPEAETYLVSFSLSAASVDTRTSAGHVPVVRGRTGLLAHPRQCSNVSVEDGNQLVQLNVPIGVLGDMMTTLTGVEASDVRFHPRIDLDGEGVAPFMRLLADVLKEAEEDRPAYEAPGVAERLAEALMFRLLLTQPHSHARLFLRSHVAEPKHVRRAAEYLESNFTRPIAMAELTAIAGVSARSLQAGFLRYRGSSPFEFVQARRLERARVLLLTSDLAASVTEVARLAGITHLGRFSVRYKARFGESPTRTLARRWRGMS